MTLESFGIIIEPIEGNFIEEFFKGLKNIDSEFSDSFMRYKDDLEKRFTELNLELYFKDLERFHIKCALYFKALALWSKFESSDVSTLNERLKEDSATDVLDLALVSLFMGQMNVKHLLEIALEWSQDMITKNKYFGILSVSARRTALLSLLLDLGYFPGVKGYFMESEKRRGLCLTLPLGFESSSEYETLLKYINFEDKS